MDSACAVFACAMRQWKQEHSFLIDSIEGIAKKTGAIVSATHSQDTGSGCAFDYAQKPRVAHSLKRHASNGHEDVPGSDIGV